MGNQILLPDENIDDDVFDVDSNKQSGFNHMQPFILRVENTTNEILHNVEILNAANRFDHLNDQAGVKISYEVQDYTYKDFIMNLISCWYGVGMIRLSFHGPDNDYDAFKKMIMFISVRDIKGNEHMQPFAPYIDPDQVAKSISDNSIKFTLDSLTKFTFHEIPANCMILITFYIESASSHRKYLHADPKIWESLDEITKEAIRKIVDEKLY